MSLVEPLRGAVHGSPAYGGANSLLRPAGNYVLLRGSSPRDARRQADAATPQLPSVARRPATQAHRNRPGNAASVPYGNRCHIPLALKNENQTNPSTAPPIMLRPDCDGAYAAATDRPQLSRLALPRRTRLRRRRVPQGIAQLLTLKSGTPYNPQSWPDPPAPLQTPGRCARHSSLRERRRVVRASTTPFTLWRPPRLLRSRGTARSTPDRSRAPAQPDHGRRADAPSANWH